MPNSSNPFIIKIEPGATEIDLGPILRPLIFAIKSNALLDPENLDEYWLKGEEALEYRKLLPTISRQMIYDYLGANGWVDEESPPRGYSYIPDYQLEKHPWERRGPWIRFNGGSKGSSLIDLDDTIRAISYSENATKVELAKAIIANANILERIVAELD